mgnify:FL=1
MIAIDTNVLLRIFITDYKSQCDRAEHLIANNDCFVSLSVLQEIIWVLTKSYGIERADISKAVREIIDTENLHLQNGFGVSRALLWFESGMDFADALDLVNANECGRFHTFDKRFVKSAKNIQSPTQVELL